MNVLITGSKGQLGSEIRRQSVGLSGCNYLFTDVAELDITSREALRTFVRDKQIGLIINCAAYTQVDKAEDDEALCTLINSTAVRYLAEVAQEEGATLIHISTDYVFSGIAHKPLLETDQAFPIGVYGKSKFDGEEAIRTSGCKHIILRTAWLYSIYGANFVKTMLRLMQERESLNVVFDQVGSPTSAADLARFILHIVSTGLYRGREGTYHFSNEGVCSWYDFACEIASLSGQQCEIKPCHSDEFPAKVKRPHYSVLDKSKVKNTFDYVIPYWKDSLKRCISELINDGN